MSSIIVLKYLFLYLSMLFISKFLISTLSFMYLCCHDHKAELLIVLEIYRTCLSYQYSLLECSHPSSVVVVVFQSSFLPESTYHQSLTPLIWLGKKLNQGFLSLNFQLQKIKLKILFVDYSNRMHKKTDWFNSRNIISHN